MALKPGPKPIAKSTGEVDKRRRDNKDTQGNNPDLKPSKPSKKQVFADRSYSNGSFCHWNFQGMDAQPVISIYPTLTTRSMNTTTTYRR